MGFYPRYFYVIIIRKGVDLMKILIDCGHCLSGADTGAQGNGKKEEVLTREVGNKALEYFRSLGHLCELTNINSGFTSVNSSLRARVNKERSYRPDIFISIHFNAGGGTGTETYVCSTGGKAYDYAKKVNNKICESTGYRNRGVKVANYYVLTNTTAPAILVECAFIDNKSDMDKYNPNALAKAIVEAVTGSKVQTNNNAQVDTQTLYKVICGSFSVKENADKMVTKLKEKGFEAFVEKYTK